MISKLPRWVWPGAWGLAFVAGIVNVVGLLGFDHHPVTHLTGTTSLLGEALSRLDGLVVGRLAALVGAFVAGAAFSGVLIGDRPLRLGRRYGVAFGIESLCLCAAAGLLARERFAGMGAAAFAVGLQNAMVSTYSGAVVRTTHVSGMFTDLGIFFGHALRGLPVDRRRGGLCFLVISGFLVGGVVGASLFRAVGAAALLVPGGLTALAALGNFLPAVRRVDAVRGMGVFLALGCALAFLPAARAADPAAKAQTAGCPSGCASTIR